MISNGCIDETQQAYRRATNDASMERCSALILLADEQSCDECVHLVFSRFTEQSGMFSAMGWLITEYRIRLVVLQDRLFDCL